MHKQIDYLFDSLIYSSRHRQFDHSRQFVVASSFVIYPSFEVEIQNHRRRRNISSSNVEIQHDLMRQIYT